MLAQARKDKGRGNFRNKKRPHAAKAKSFVGLTPEMAVLYPPTSQEYDELTNGIQAYMDNVHESSPRNSVLMDHLSSSKGIAILLNQLHLQLHSIETSKQPSSLGMYTRLT